MKNRAGLLALLVLAIATIVMVFFVMPRMNVNKDAVGDAVNQAATQVQQTASEVAKTGRNAAEDIKAASEKMGRLTADASSSLGELKALFADDKGPTADVFGPAKTKAVSSLKALADFSAPEITDAMTIALIAKAKDGAAKAAAIIEALPENIADALAAIAKASAVLTGAPEPAAAPAVAAAPQTDANAGALAAPTFDVLRVEPDGSTVIAGSAPGSTKLDIMDGDKTITSTEVGPSGDFAAVLDNPLPAGDHELVLKATGKDGKTSVSEEVATVSVPKDLGGQLLAMVTKPGQASRIITAPAAKPAAETASADAQPATPATAPAAAAPAATTPAPDQSAAATPSTPAPAATDGSSGTAAALPAASGTPDIMVNAVEIEGNKIFVAGTARPKANVRAFADDTLIGNAVAGADGHFVIDGVLPLSVGDHKIKAEVVDDKGGVLVRAIVNFNRPEGNQVTVAAKATADAPVAMIPLDEGELGKLKEDAVKAFGLLKGLFADGKLPGAEQLAAARSATEIALRSLSEFRPAAEAAQTFKDKATAASNSATEALTALKALPIDAKSVADALGKIGDMIASLTAPVASTPTSIQSATTSSGDTEPKTIEQAPLAADASSVIIRRGDTLWQISRRVYGAGVRYTTIYVANEDKITNPDKILPGQVFGLPKDALPNSEELHRKWKSGQKL